MLLRQLAQPLAHRGGDLVVGTKLQETRVGALGIVDASNLGVGVPQVLNSASRVSLGKVARRKAR
jgi:hypothetical protein